MRAEDTMGNVIDLQAARATRASAARDNADAGAWADLLAAAWYSPAGRLIGCALVFAVLLTGLSLLVFCAAAILGRF